MISHGTVHGTQQVAPPNVEINHDCVYVRGTPIRKSRTEGEGENARTDEFWEYSETLLTLAEYNQARALMLTIPNDMWDEGMQTMMRSLRYERMDGPRSKAERDIRLGQNVTEAQNRLQVIDGYCEAVRQTKNAPGYPKNVPVYPPEPAL